MQAAVTIKNRLPESLTCTGLRFHETRMLGARALAPLIERDVLSLLKKLPGLKPDLSLSVVEHDGITQFRISILINYAGATQALARRVESILWAYNDQILIAKGGVLRVFRTRFQHHIGIEARDQRDQTSRNERGYL